MHDVYFDGTGLDLIVATLEPNEIASLAAVLLLAPVHLFVPSHGFLQRGHSVAAFVDVVVLDVDH